MTTQLYSGERSMLPGLLSMLRSSGRVRTDTEIVMELPWNGRRIDLATLTRCGRTSAYELKLGNFPRVLEQAIYNRLSFDRSWIVVDTAPTRKNLDFAISQGIGVIVVKDVAQVILRSPTLKPEPA